MTVTIGVSGKGGSGKTIIVSVLMDILHKKYPEKSILAIDANLNSDLGRYLGVEVDNTLYDIRTGQYKYQFNLPDNISRKEYTDICIEDILVSVDENIDVLACGTPFTVDCTCYMAKIIRERVDALAKNYDFVIIDCSDDIIYLENVINASLDSIIIISDSSRSGITSSARIKYSAREKLLPNQTTLILNKIKQKNLPDSVKALIDKFDLEIVGIIPYDEDLREYEYAGKSIYKIDYESPIPQAVEQTIYRLNLPR